MICQTDFTGNEIAKGDSSTGGCWGGGGIAKLHKAAASSNNTVSGKE